MAETSRPWDGTAVGDALEAPYNAGTEFSYLIAAASGAVGTANNGGVVRNYSATNNLMVSGIASPLSVQAGDAFVNGTHYNNSAALSVVVPTPAGATRIDRIVLRKSWAAQTIRVTRIIGVEGGGVPALTQVIGTTWEVPIAQASITIGGVITVTDEREYLTGGVGPFLISSDILTAAVSSIDILNIPQNLKDLRLVLCARGTVALAFDNANIRFNSDAGLNYDIIYNTSDGAVITPFAAISVDRGWLGIIDAATAPANQFGIQDISIPNYSSSSMQKRVIGSSACSTDLRQFSILWKVTSAITKITLFTFAGNFDIGTSYSLYGQL